MENPVAQPSEGRGATVGAVEHAIAILRCLSGSPEPLGINEIARRIGLHKSSISRLVATLVAARLVERDAASARIKLGPGLVLLAAPVLAELHIKDLVRPALEELAARSGETASFNMWDGSDAVTIEQVPGPGAVRIFSEPGRRDPGHCTACGKILLAHEPSEAIEAYCAGVLERFNERTVIDPAVLRRELGTSRQRGYALNFGELDGEISAISAVTHDARGKVVGSITVTVPSYRFTQERQEELIAMVVETARRLSRSQG